MKEPNGQTDQKSGADPAAPNPYPAAFPTAKGDDEAQTENAQYQTDVTEDDITETVRGFGNFVKKTFQDAKPGERLTAWLTIILITFSFATAVVFYLQLRQMRKATDAATKAAGAANSAADTAAAQLEMTDRPWVTIDVVITGPLTYSDKEGVFMSFLFIPKNIGRSPAQNVLISPMLIPAFPFDDIRKEQNGICKNVGESGFSTYVLFPNEPFSESFRIEESPESIVKRWGKQPQGWGLPDPMPVTLVGCVDYTYETSRVHHQTGFALDVAMKTTGGMPLRSLTPITPNSLVLRQHPSEGHFAN